MTTASVSTIANRTASSRSPGVVVRVGLAVAVALAMLMLPVGKASADVTFNQRMLELVNRDRSANGLAPLVSDVTLSADAEDAPYSGCGFLVRGRAMDMGQRNYFSHTILGCGVQGVFDLLNATGAIFSGAGENIAWASGLSDPLVAAENLHSQLMNSASHRANILNASFTKIGIGSWHTDPGQTWSGGGVALSRVFIAAQIFGGGPVSPGGGTAPPAGVRFHPLTPSRILDTRTGNGSPVGPLGPGATLNLQATGRGGVPSTGVSAVVLNVAVTAPTASGWLTVFPAGEVLPMASSLNFVAGQTVSNVVTAKLGANGQLALYNSAGSTHMIADIAGWYDAR